jgi:hypothetical protein
MKRMHEVKAKTKNPNCIGTISAEDLRKMDNRARREIRIASGINTASGSGVHGGNKQQLNRRDRRAGKDQLRRFQGGE